MKREVLLLLVAILCDWLLIGIFSYDYKKKRDRNNIFIVLGLVIVFFICLYYLLQKMGVVIVL